MALIKLSDYYPADSDSICDALDSLSEATSVKITDDPNMYFDGSPCALGVVLKETPAVGIDDFTYYVGLEGDCLRPLPDPGPLVYDHTTIKPMFLFAEETKAVSGGADYGTPNERDPIEMASVTVPVFAQEMTILVYFTILWHPDGGGRSVKFLMKYGEQLAEPEYTELYQEESGTLWWKSTGSYVNSITHHAGNEAKIRMLIKHMSGTVKVITSAIVFKSS